MITKDAAPSFSLRPATDDDLNLIRDLEVKIQTAPWTRDHFQAELEKEYSRILVLTDDETDSLIAGYICYWLLDEAEIQTVGVDLPYRGMGFGSTLVRRAIREALRADFGRVRLEVRKSNESAIQMYQKIGFAIARVHKSFYSNGEDAYVMEIDLSGRTSVEF